MKCKLCKGHVPRFDWGIGEWLYLENGAELGPFCSSTCLELRRTDLENKQR